MELVPDEYKKSYLLHRQGKKMEAFSTHQPLLIHVLNTITKGKVLEFGVGFNSTPIINTICREQGREAISLETNPKWFSKFKHYRRDQHRVILVSTKIIANCSFLRKPYSIAFIDGSPAEVRQGMIERIKNSVDYIIVHDSEPIIEGIVNCYGYDFSMFKHVLHFAPMFPANSLLFNLEELDEDILKFFNT